MSLRQGKKALAETQPNFSTQGVENAIKNITDMGGWTAASYALDLAIEEDTVMTSSQKTDLNDTINHQINLGRLLGDLRRHCATIIDGTIFQTGEGELAINFNHGVMLIAGLQATIPEALGVSAVDKNRSVDEHLGILRGILLETSDSSRPPLISMIDAVKFLSGSNRGTETTYVNAINDLKAFVQDMRDDSTDFQQSLDSRAALVSSTGVAFFNDIGSEPQLTYRKILLADREDILNQITREKDNNNTLRSYSTMIADTIQLQGLGSNREIANVLSKVAQNKLWQDYYENYDERQKYINPLYDLDDQNLDLVVKQRLAERNLPDVLDFMDTDRIVEKAKKHPKVDTKGFDVYTNEQLIPIICDQLAISTQNLTFYSQSEKLLTFLNEYDIQVVKDSITLNTTGTTFS